MADAKPKKPRRMTNRLCGATLTYYGLWREYKDRREMLRKAGVFGKPAREQLEPEFIDKLKTKGWEPDKPAPAALKAAPEPGEIPLAKNATESRYLTAEDLHWVATNLNAEVPSPAPSEAARNLLPAAKKNAQWFWEEYLAHGKKVKGQDDGETEFQEKTIEELIASVERAVQAGGAGSEALVA